jgi:ATP synthase subunit 6
MLKDNLSWSDIIYFVLLYTIFIFILFSNIVGIFPYTFTITGHLVVTFGIAFCIFLGLNIIGYRIHTSYLLSLLLPSGVPFAISSLLIIIEFISYNFRVISLSVRLFANIMAGHTLLAVIFGFNRFLLTIKTTNILVFIMPLIILPCLLLVIALIGLEFGVAVIQAYVFTLLCTMYLHDAKYLH